MENFSNSILLPEDLPHIESKTFNPLDKKYQTILFLRTIILFLIAILALVTFLILSTEQPPTAFIIISFSIVAVFTTCSTVLIIFGFPKKGYLVREKDISFQRGLITYKLISVPFNRIQHVEVNQGVLAKILKLSSVKIYTAGGNASDVSIPGLPVEIAQNLKTFLSEKISEHE
jgi:membrane protein YdbS with pleckstrin-like domain